MSPRPVKASQDIQPAEKKRTIINQQLFYYEYNLQHTHNTLVTGGKLMEPGLGTNPRSSGNGVGKGCRPAPGRPRIQGAVSEEGKSEVGK